MRNPNYDWGFIHKFQSASSTQKYLERWYQHQKQISNKKSYENCYPFMYYLEHGETYYKQAAHSPLSIQPVLLFYGYTHLLKAMLLTVDPDYPQTSSVLAHGVSTRKRKKQQYSFLEDEIKIQKNGLLPHIADCIFHMNSLEGEKFTMKQLLAQLPEVQELFQFHYKESPLVLLKQSGDILTFPMNLLDQFHMTLSRFQEYITTIASHPIIRKENGFTWTTTPSLMEAPPFRYHIEFDQYYFPSNKKYLCQLPELLIHYLLLYNLSMIARYETEWWSDLLKTTPNEDYSFIKGFLMSSFTKMPKYIEKYLLINH
ncbi:YaaC family protein [Bacillus spongiae]|uniref:YaaC family protein n=1 Tax=Bacillus spongiae TaxID=2683610 RepID=A0ABU8HKR9_9BACI